MDFSVFDSYNLRARISVYIIIITPAILTLYALYEPIRSISFSAVLLAILAAFANYLFAMQRHIKKSRKYENTAASFLHLSDSHLDQITKQRYYSKLASLDESFKTFNSPSETDEFKATCASAVSWLRNNTRDNKLVQEENILYGFYRNLCAFKPIGIIFTIIAFGVQILNTLPAASITDIFQSKTIIVLLLIDLLFLIFWIAGVNKKTLKAVAEKYAIALLGALDSIKPGN